MFDFSKFISNRKCFNNEYYLTNVIFSSPFPPPEYLEITVGNYDTANDVLVMDSDLFWPGKPNCISYIDWLF